MYGLIFGIIFAAISFGILRGGIGAVVAILCGLFGFATGYIGMPTLAYGWFGIPFALTILSLVILVVTFFSQDHDENVFAFIGSFVILGFSLIALLVVPLITTWSAFHAEKYRALLGEVKESQFSSDVAPIDPTTVRLVDQRQAKKLAETKLGEDTALGSRVAIGTFNIQSVNGKLYWVAPLVWRDVFKWGFGDIGTPGYMKVSATNQRDVQLIREVNNEPIRLQILNEGGYFGDFLIRILYNNGYATQGYGDYTFEINDEGRPYWVVTKIKKAVGFGGSIADGVIVVDPQTREITEYSIDEAPRWIDRIQPESLITTRINDWGDLVHGWWNPSGLDRVKTTKGMSLVYGNDAVAYWYTGIQTVGADQGTLGFMLINTRTGQAKMYKLPGITEEACQRNIVGLIAEKPNWVVTNCILYNVGGAPTYIAIIKDADGNPKEVGIASVEYRNVVVSHTEIRGALRAYKAKMRSKGGSMSVDAMSIEQFEIRGAVLRINKEILDGNTVYYLMVDTQPNKLLTASSGLSPELAVTEVGDKVRVKVDDPGLSVIDIASFDNLAIELKRTEK